MARGAAALGVPGRLACLLAVILAASGVSGPRVGIALVLAVALALAFHRSGLAVLKAPFLWVMVLLFMLPPLMLTRGQAWGVGLEMSTRAVSIVLAVSGFASTVPVTGVAALLERAGLAGIGFALGVAVNALPGLHEAATTTWQAFRQRGGLRRRPLRGLYLVLTTMITEALRRAEEMVVAAHARGFGGKRRPSRIIRGRLDVPVTLGLAAVVALILFAPIELLDYLR